MGKLYVMQRETLFVLSCPRIPRTMTKTRAIHLTMRCGIQK